MGNPGLVQMSPAFFATQQSMPSPSQAVAARPVTPPGLLQQTARNDAPAETWPAPPDPGVDEAFEATVYSSQMRYASLATRFREVAARLAENHGAREIAAQEAQMTFDFFAESKTEIRIGFQQRSAALAEGLDAPRQATYLEISREVAARFEFSGSISGAALQGFAGASESLSGEETLFDKLMALANQLLEMGNAFFDEVMRLFEGFPGGSQTGSYDDFLRETLNRFLQGLPGMDNTAPGMNGSAVAEFQLEFRFEISVSAQFTFQELQGEVQQADPIILDINGNGFDLTNYRDGARFDILGNGRAVPSAFVTGGDAFLAIDRNGDGIINSGRELFGDQNGAADGFEELRKLDGNGDGVIDRHDADFDKLLLWRDNGNGRTEPGELVSLRDAGIASISLNYRNVNHGAAGGNRIAQLATFRWSDGRTGDAGDAILNYIA